jgi:hypothetical protein
MNPFMKESYRSQYTTLVYLWVTDPNFGVTFPVTRRSHMETVGLRNRIRMEVIKTTGHKKGHKPTTKKTPSGQREHPCQTEPFKMDPETTLSYLNML